MINYFQPLLAGENMEAKDGACASPKTLTKDGGIESNIFLAPGNLALVYRSSLWHPKDHVHQRGD